MQNKKNMSMLEIPKEKIEDDIESALSSYTCKKLEKVKALLAQIEMNM